MSWDQVWSEFDKGTEWLSAGALLPTKWKDLDIQWREIIASLHSTITGSNPNEIMFSWLFENCRFDHFYRSERPKCQILAYQPSSNFFASTPSIPTTLNICILRLWCWWDSNPVPVTKNRSFHFGRENLSVPFKQSRKHDLVRIRTRDCGVQAWNNFAPPNV